MARWGDTLDTISHNFVHLNVKHQGYSTVVQRLDDSDDALFDVVLPHHVQQTSYQTIEGLLEINTLRSLMNQVPIWERKVFQ